MGGNKVAAPPKGKVAAPQGTGKIYSGKSTVQDNGGLTGGAGKRVSGATASGIGGGAGSGA